MAVTQIGSIAFLVDGENASPELVGDMLNEVSKYGPVTIRRVYGDWSTGQMSSWRKKLEEHALMAEMVVPHVHGKNAADIRLVIDAMDIIRKGVVKGFCIVSSDSDFTNLAMKIREEGLFAIGIGESKAPSSLRRACDIFIATENLSQSRAGKTESEQPHEKSKPKSSVQEGNKEKTEIGEDQALTPVDALKILINAYDNVVGEEGRVHLSLLQESVHRLDPSFDPRTYGRKKLIQLIRELPQFSVDQEHKQGPGGVYISMSERPDQEKKKRKGQE